MPLAGQDPDEEYFPSDFSRRQTLDMLAGGALMTALPIHKTSTVMAMNTIALEMSADSKFR